MNHVINRDLFQQCEAAFLSEIVKTIRVIVRRISLSEVEKDELVSALAFGVAAHVGGSSYGGSVAGKEVYPVLGFVHGDLSATVNFGGASRLHELVPGILAKDS